MSDLDAGVLAEKLGIGPERVEKALSEMGVPYSAPPAEPHGIMVFRRCFAMAGLEYRFPPLTEEEKERGRRRFLNARRSNAARYYKDSESLRLDLGSEMKRKGLTVRILSQKSGESEKDVDFLVGHGYAPVGTTMKVLAALGVKPANLPHECITCHIGA